MYEVTVDGVIKLIAKLLRQYHKCLTLVDDIVNASALTEKIDNLLKIKYFFITFTTIIVVIYELTLIITTGRQC